MQRTLNVKCLALLLCCGCAANEQSRDASHANEFDASASPNEGVDATRTNAFDASADDDGAALSSDAEPASSSVDAAMDHGPQRDAAHDSAMLGVDASVGPALGDACVLDACTAPAKCDDDHPCGTSDDVCVAQVCRPDPNAPPAAWRSTTWSGRVGLVGDDDTTLWCTPGVTGAALDHAAPAGVTSQFERIALDASRQLEVTAAHAAQRVRFQCFADAARTGPSTLVTSIWSADSEHDVVRARCPRERPYAAFVQCQIAAQGKPPFVYAGPSCGDGVAGLVENPTVHGQLVGDHYELAARGKPLFNNTGKAAVVGTDLGFQFLAQGRMYIGFGDTWENEASVPGPNGYRGSILAYTRDFDPADSNGIAFEAWETTSDRPDVAREVIPSPHDPSGATEFTAIAAAGFGLSDGANHYRFLWFASIKTWDPFTNNESTLAWSQNGGPFTRGDKAPSVHTARWPFETYFGPGAVWVDREHGYVYFFGVRTYQAGFPIRLARVQATVAAVLDHLQYEYWTGSTWQRPDPKDEYALARLADAAADLVPGGTTQNNRPELSVAYNPYVGRFIMLVQNDPTPFNDEAQTHFQIWEAEAVEGPWKLADTGDRLVLPPHLYGPYMSEQTLSDGGRDVYFALSEWNLLPLIFGQPYVVGLWSMRLERRVRPGCAQMQP